MSNIEESQFIYVNHRINYVTHNLVKTFRNYWLKKMVRACLN